MCCHTDTVIRKNIEIIKISFDFYSTQINHLSIRTMKSARNPKHLLDTHVLLN